MATSLDAENEKTVQSSSLPSPQEDEDRIRLSRTTSTQTDSTNPKESSSEPPAKTVSSDVPSSSLQQDLLQSTSPVEPPVQESGPHPKPVTKRTSKWAKQKVLHPEEGWDDNTQVNGSVMEYESSVETLRRTS